MYFIRYVTGSTCDRSMGNLCVSTNYRYVHNINLWMVVSLIGFWNIIFTTSFIQRSDSYRELHLEIDNVGRFKTKLCQMWWLNFSNSSNIPTTPVCGVCISQLICFYGTYAQYIDFLDRAQLQTQKLLKQGYFAPRLKSSLQKLYGRHHN